jgi:hypothetical protein
MLRYYADVVESVVGGINFLIVICEKVSARKEIISNQINTSAP